MFPCNASHARDGPDWRLVGNAWPGCTIWFRHRLRASGCRKFGGTHGCGMQCMTQFETEVPGPLCQNEPELLAPGGMRAPAVWLLFLVFVSQHCLKSATMHVQGHDISRCERAWWQGGVEQFVDVLTTRGADLHRRIWSFPCGNDDSRARSGW